MILPNDLTLLCKHIINFYTRTTHKVVNSIDEIPVDTLTIILHMRYVDIIEQSVLRDHNKKLSLRFIADRYGVGVRVIRRIVS